MTNDHTANKYRIPKNILFQFFYSDKRLVTKVTIFRLHLQTGDHFFCYVTNQVKRIIHCKSKKSYCVCSSFQASVNHAWYSAGIFFGFRGDLVLEVFKASRRVSSWSKGTIATHWRWLHSQRQLHQGFSWLAQKVWRHLWFVDGIA